MFFSIARPHLVNRPRLSRIATYPGQIHSLLGHLVFVLQPIELPVTLHLSPIARHAPPVAFYAPAIAHRSSPITRRPSLSFDLSNQR